MWQLPDHKPAFLMSVFSNRSSTKKSDDTMDDDTDDKDDTKRKSRNLSEKKRRDQFNLLINELSSMVSANGRKMDKSTVLKSTISFLKNHNDLATRSRSNEIQEDWKPSFLSNEEFTHLFLEAVDGFIIAFSTTGRILYVSESVTSLLGHLPSNLLEMTVYEVTHEVDHSDIYNVLLRPLSDVYKSNKETEVSLMCHFKRGSSDQRSVPIYEVVQLSGYIKHDLETSHIEKGPSSRYSGYSEESDSRMIFVGTGRIQTPQLIREVLIMDSGKSEFTSRHSLEWKFLFLDHRAPPIIGYLPFEVLGTSGYDYYHVDDLDKVVNCHEALMQKGEGTSCFYRFLTKGQQWIWLQTRFYITYHQWNSKPEFIVCMHRVVSYVNLLKQGGGTEVMSEDEKPKIVSQSSVWSSKSSVGKQSNKRLGGSDSNSISADSSILRHSQLTSPSLRSGQAASSSSKGDCSKVPSPQVESSSYSQGQFMPQTSHQPAVHQVNQLERKHVELQQLIVEQQAELRRLSEQLLMARYGLLPSIINVTVPYTVGQPNASSELYVTPTPVAVPPVIVDHHQIGVNPQDGYQMAAPPSSTQGDLLFPTNISETPDHQNH